MSQETKHARWFEGRLGYWLLVAVVAVVAAGVTALLMNISERKAEQRRPFIRVVEVTDNDTDPAMIQLMTDCWKESPESRPT